MTAPVSSREAGVGIAITSTADVCTLVDGLDRRASGELLVRTNDVRGVVFVEGGRVCWAAASGLARRLTELLLAHASGIDAGAMEELFRQCQAGGAPLGETLVDRGIVSAFALRRALLLHTTESLVTLCKADSLAFWRARSGRGYSPRFTFTTTELFAESLGATQPPMNAKAILETTFVGGEWGAAFVRGRGAAPAPVAIHGDLPDTVADVVRVGKWAASALDVSSTFQDDDALVTTLDGSAQVLVAWRGPEPSFFAGRMHAHGPARILNRRAQVRRGSE